LSYLGEIWYANRFGRSYMRYAPKLKPEVDLRRHCSYRLIQIKFVADAESHADDDSRAKIETGRLIST